MAYAPILKYSANMFEIRLAVALIDTFMVEMGNCGVNM